MYRRIAFVVAVSTWLYTGGLAWGIDLLNGDLKLSGFAWNESSVATDGGLHRDRPYSAGFKQGDLERMRWTVQLEANYKLIHEMAGFKNVGIYAIGRYARQTEYEVDKSIPSPEQYGLGKGVKTFNGTNYHENLDLREIYLYTDLTDLPGGTGFLSIGTQQVVWGESDGFRLADIVNPLDLSWHYFLEPFPDIRTTLPLLRMFYYPDALKASLNARFETVWVFGDFEPTDFAPIYCGSSNPCPASVAPGVVPGAFWNFGFDQNTAQIDNRPSGLGAGSAIGERLTIRPTDAGPLTDYEISLYDYYRHYDFPTFNVRGDGQTQFSYPSQNLMGVTFNRYYDDFLFWRDAKLVFRGEGVYTDKLPLTGNADEGFALKKRSAFKWVIGFDRPTDLPWWGGDFGKLLGLSPPGRTTFLAIQWFQTYIAGEKSGESGSESGPRQWPTILTFYAGQRWLTGEELQPALFVAYEEPQGNILIQPSVQYRYGNYWLFGLTYNAFETFSNGVRRDGFFGPFLQRDELMGKVQFQF